MEEVVAIILFRVVSDLWTLLHQGNLQTEAARGRSGLGAPVGVEAGPRDDIVGTLCDSVSHQVFELPRLVTPEGQAREIVPFD